MIIGIDLDGTLAKFEDFTAPDVIGDPNPDIVNLVKRLADAGHELYLWTCRADYVAQRWLMKHTLSHFFLGVNYSPYTSDSIKPSFDYYVGDEALHFNGTNAMRIFDHIQNKNLKPECAVLDRDKDFMSHQPVPYLAGTGRGYIDMFEAHWRELWKEHDYGNKHVAFMTICSHAKPYSKSHIHSCIRQELWRHNKLDALDYIHISNAGIIPSGDEMTYPFNAYDHDGSQMSDEVMKYFSEVTERRISYWATEYGSAYRHIVVYLRRGKTYKAAERALFNRENVTFIDVSATQGNYPAFALYSDADDCLTSNRNLGRLASALQTIFQK